MTTFISLDRIKRDQAYELTVRSYNLATSYMDMANVSRTNSDFVKAKKHHKRAIHNLHRAYVLACKYNFGIIIKINTAFTECDIDINNR